MLTTIQIIDLIISLILAIFIGFILIKFTKSKFIIILTVLLYIADFLLNFYQISTASEILNCILIALLVLFFNTYSGKIRRTITKMFNSKSDIGLDDAGKEEFINAITTSILDLSSTKTGALITIETDEDLQEFIDKGEKIDSPVSSTLLRTIFYNGTPLHDGAVIIRGNIIKAGSVFYNPTTKAMVGKYGARHRAAIGFSEVHDSITIVVSEETGRISFAINGELINVNHDNFEKKLRDYLK